MVTRRRQRLVDFGAALAMIVAGWTAGHQKVISVQDAKAESAVEAANAVHSAMRVELAPVRADLAQLSVVTSSFGTRLGRVEGEVATLSQAVTRTSP